MHACLLPSWLDQLLRGDKAHAIITAGLTHGASLPLKAAAAMCLFAALLQGDSHGARCLQSPYRLLQLPHEVQLEMPLPFWVVPEEDLQVRPSCT